MRINIKPAAQDYLRNKIQDTDNVFLALDDGSSKYSMVGGTCTIGSSFQLVLRNDDDADYAIGMDNNANLALTTGDEESTYLGNGLALDYKNAALVLRDDSGIIDGNVTVARYVPQDLDTEELRQQMQALVVNICGA